MKMIFVVKAFAAALLTVAAAFAHAGFINEGGVGDIRVIGSLANEEKAIGLGRNVPIREAVRQVIPADFAIRFANGAESIMEKRTTWRGGRPWSDVLTGIVETVPELSAEIDAKAKVVTFVGPDVGRARESSGQGEAAGGLIWKIHSGAIMSETLSAWGRIAGWQGVVWDAPPLMSEMEVSFSGSFEDAVTNTVKALNRNGAQLQVIFYGGNKVVRIVESK